MNTNQSELNLTAENLNKVLYALPQQVELVKYLLQTNPIAWADPAQRVVETILKNGKSLTGRNRVQVPSIDSSSLVDIFVMINNFAVRFMQDKHMAKAQVLLTCAISISK